MINRGYNITGAKKSFLLDIKDIESTSIHCHLALEDVLNTLVDKRFTKIDYIYTTKDIIIKIDSFSFKMNVPITYRNLKEFVGHIKHYVDGDRSMVESLFLEYTDLKNVGSIHCNDCKLNGTCLTMFSYLEKRE